MLTQIQTTKSDNLPIKRLHAASLIIGTLFIVIIVLTSACSSRAAGSDQALSINDVWGRPSPMMAETAAFYMAIANNRNVDDTLVAAEAAVCNPTELHTTHMDNGVMKMRQVEGGIPIPANSTTALEPGSFHIMCIGLTQPLATGEEIPLTLTFAEAGEIEVTAVIREE